MAALARFTTPRVVRCKTYQAQAEKLRKGAAQCSLNPRRCDRLSQERELFDRLASHLTILADQVELALIPERATHPEIPDARGAYERSDQ